MTEAERQTPDTTGMQLAVISSAARYILEQVGKLRFFNCWQAQADGRIDGLDRFPKARLVEEATTIAAALGYRLVKIEPEPVTSEPGFDNRHIPTSPAQTPPDGGRWNEHSTAQEGV